MRMRIFGSVLVFVLSIGLSNRADAQNCNRNCDPSQRDAHGCCTAAKKKKKKKKKKCPRGQKITADTAGHCCWPGQAWNGARCVGTPTKCPTGWEQNSERQVCLRTPKKRCEEGMVQTHDKKHCCWPGQAWSSIQNRCVGVPECPPGTTMGGDTCTGRGTPVAIDTSEMVSVPEGPYQRGSTRKAMEAGLDVCNETYTTECNVAWFEREGPRVEISLSKFEIDKFEVTNAQYAACVEAGGCSPIDWGKCSLFDEATGSWGVGITPHPKLRTANHPVVCTSWHDADGYCRWAGKRLPTESEWEKAARGHRDTRQFPWGEQFDANALNWGENTGFGSQDGFVTSSPVGHYKNGASPYGALDMSGNAMEWTGDWFDENFYRSGPRKDPISTNKSSGTRIARGGSWTFAGNAGRVSYRFFLDPRTREDGVGFRCVRGPNMAPAASESAARVTTPKGDKDTLSQAGIQAMITQAGYTIVTTKDEQNPGVRAKVWIVKKGTDNAAITRWSFDNPKVFAPQTIEHLKRESGFVGKQFGEIVISVYVPNDTPSANRILTTLLTHR